MLNFIKSYIERSKQKKQQRKFEEQIDNEIVKHMEVHWSFDNSYTNEFYERNPEFPRYGFWTYTCSYGRTIFVEGDFKPIVLLKLAGYYEVVRADVIRTYLPTANFSLNTSSNEEIDIFNIIYQED